MISLRSEQILSGQLMHWWFLGSVEPPSFAWLHLDKEVLMMLKLMEPPFLAIELRKMVLLLSVACFNRKKAIGLVGLIIPLKMIKVDMILPQSGRGS